MLKIAIIVEAFCSKHGLIREDLDNCPMCGQSLNVTRPYTVIRKCDKCKEEVEAPPSYFSENNDKCPCCVDGVLRVQHFIRNDAPHFVLDGSWDGKDRSKIIMEKNKQLRDRNAGYSHEQQSIKEKTTKALQEKGIL